MSLTDSQKEAVSSWIAKGKSLADVQRLLREEFSISMTYMDVRFLIDDLNISMKEEEKDEEEAGDEDGTSEKVVEPEVVEEGVGHGVSVEVDAVTPPGALMSGSATFSDGVTLGWQLLANGQLGLTPGDDNPGYRPSVEDMEDFRIQMDGIIRKKGFGA